MNARRFSELRDALSAESPSSEAQVAEKVAALNDHLALADLRAHRARTQSQLAAAIGTTQSAISRLERQPDVLVSTLRDYIEATGGRLRVIADFGDYEVDLDLPALRQRAKGERREFRVIWQNLQTRQLVHVGSLRAHETGFTFNYTEDADRDPDFELFGPFPDLHGLYESDHLFSFFADRVLSASQPGYDNLISALGLSRTDATPVELLARSWGRSSHDTIQIVPEPVTMSDGTSTRLFLVSGVSHADPDNPDRVTTLISKLKAGAQLTLTPEPDNPVNPDAVLVEINGQRLGWIPDYLLSELHKAIASAHTAKVNVERASGPETPWHLRLLCRLELAIADPPGPLAID